MAPGDDLAYRQVIFGRATACCPFRLTMPPSWSVCSISPGSV